MIHATIRAPVQPTESAAKVEAAIHRLFPSASLSSREGFVEGASDDLDRFASLIRAQRIPDTARGVMLRGQDGAQCRFVVSKQAAAAGRLNFTARGGPLGDVHVELRAETSQELSGFIDSIAPDTRAWSLEDRGLTEKGLRAQEADEGVLDKLERELDEPDRA